MLKMYIISIYLHEILSILSIFFSATCLFYGGYYIIWNCTIYYSYSILLVTIDVWCKFYVKSQKSKHFSKGMYTIQTLCICLFTMFLRAIHNCKKKLQRNISGKRMCIKIGIYVPSDMVSTWYHGCNRIWTEWVMSSRSSFLQIAPIKSKEIYFRDKIPKFIQSRSKRVTSHENNYLSLFPSHFITNSSLHKRKRLFIGSTQAHTPDRDHITLYV